MSSSCDLKSKKLERSIVNRKKDDDEVNITTDEPIATNRGPGNHPIRTIEIGQGSFSGDRVHHFNLGTNRSFLILNNQASSHSLIPCLRCLSKMSTCACLPRRFIIDDRQTDKRDTKLSARETNGEESDVAIQSFLARSQSTVAQHPPRW